MAKRQKLIHLHGDSKYVGQVAIGKGEIVVTHANDAVDTELAVLSNTDAVVYFPSLDKVNAADSQIRTDFAAADSQIRTDFAAVDTAIRGEFAAADKALSDRIDALVTGDTSVGKQIETALETAKTYADGLNEAMDDRVKALEGDGENTGVLAEAKGYTDTEIGKVNTEVAKKADKTAMETALAGKADATETTNALNLKANAADVYTKGEVDAELAKKADKSTTYTKTEVDNLLSPKADAADVNAHVNNGDIHVTAQQKTHWQAATDAINAFIASADHQGEAVDTLKEIQDFLTSDDGTVQALLKDVATNKQAIADEKTARETTDNGFETRIATLEGKFTGEDSVADQIEAALETAKGYTDAEIDKVEGTINDMDAAYKLADTNLETTLKAYADQAETDAIASGKTYTDGKIGEEVTRSNKYADDAVAVEVAARETAISGVTTAFEAADTAIRGEFAAADDVVRGEFAAADTALSNRIKAIEDANPIDTVVIENTTTNKITATKAEKTVTFNFDEMVIDCGTY